MPEPNQINFSHKEVATALIRANDIHDGVWGLYIRFGMRGMNFGTTDNDLNPTAIVPILSIGLQRFEKVNNLSVDAAEVNPRHPKEKLVGTGKTKGAKKR